MHALIDEPGRVPAELYRRFVRHALTDGLMADHLVAGEPYLALNALVLDRDEHCRLGQLTTAFARSFDVAGQALRSDVATLVDIGFPWVAAELLAAEAPRTPVVGRFDFLLDARGTWQLLEYNADTPSGLREGTTCDALVHRMLVDARSCARPNADFAGRLIDAFDAATPEGPALGIITSAGELEDLAQAWFLGDLLRPRLATRSIDVVIGDHENLRATRRGARLCGHPIHALYRLYPFEAMLGEPTFAALFESVLAGRLTLLNGLYGLLLQHKGVLAWLWEHRDDPTLDAEARAAIHDHLPPTWWIESAPEAEPRNGLVAKQVFGREGEEVHFGADLSSAAWDELRRRRTYVAQRRVDAPAIGAVVPTSAGQVHWQGQATVGPFTVDGAWAGYYSRFGGKIVTSRAKWLATFVAP